MMHDAVYQITGLGDVVCLEPSERESQWIARSVDAYLHLRAEPPSTSPKSLRPLSPFLLQHACLVFNNSVKAVTNRTSDSTSGIS